VVGVLPLALKELDKPLPDALAAHELLLLLGLGLCSFSSAGQILDGDGIGTGLSFRLLSPLLGGLHPGISVNLGP
jgi:hypothetical protein